MRILFGLGLGLVVGSAVGQQGATPAFPTNEQMRHYKTLGDPRLSPEGKRVLLRITDTTADGAKAHLWVVDVDGAEAPRQLTYSPDADKRGERDGEWMPDGKSILFVAKRGEHAQLFRLPMNGARPRRSI